MPSDTFTMAHYGPPIHGDKQYGPIGSIMTTNERLKVIYKLLNKIFGWDYVSWRNTASQGVARVHRSGCGVVFYWRYKSIKLADQIHDRGQVIWLTCDPDKYGL